MAHSSCSNTFDSMRYERVSCGECGRKALVLVSHSVKNPGRLYYGCSVHGWLKWVVPATMETERDSHHGRRRFTSERHEDGASIDVETLKNFGCNCKGIVLALVIANLVLLAANLFGLLIQLVRG